MDFGKIDLAANSERGADCHLNHPVTGKPLYTEKGEKITIRVLGQDSAKFRKAVSSRIDLDEDEKNDADAREARSVELISAIVVGWKNIVWEGKELPFSPQNVRMFLTKFPPIRSQLDSFVSKRANFTSDGSTD